MVCWISCDITIHTRLTSNLLSLVTVGAGCTRWARIGGGTSDVVSPISARSLHGADRADRARVATVTVRGGRPIVTLKGVLTRRDLGASCGGWACVTCGARFVVKEASFITNSSSGCSSGCRRSFSANFAHSTLSLYTGIAVVTWRAVKLSGLASDSPHTSRSISCG